MIKHLLGPLFFLLSTLAFAKVSKLPPLNKVSEIQAWIREASFSKDSDETLCREIMELATTYLCLSHEKNKMVSHLGRASAFIEGDREIAQGTILGQSSDHLARYNEETGGLDLLAKDIARFVTQVELACKDDQDKCLSEDESDFVHLFFDSHLKSEAHIFISLSLDSTALIENLGHELLHAQFFLNPIFYDVVEDFWLHQFSSTDREGVSWFLSQYYDLSNHYLLINELQAYLLMMPRKRPELEDYRRRFTLKLISALKKHGINPVSLNFYNP